MICKPFNYSRDLERMTKSWPGQRNRIDERTDGRNDLYLPSLGGHRNIRLEYMTFLDIFFFIFEIY